MHRISTDSDITLFSRFECKYIVSPMVVPAFREAIEPFMRPDGYAARHPDFRYPICSLYLDSDDLRLYQQTVGGDKKRFKLRVRSYGDDPAEPVFLEVKRKIDAIVSKRRARVDRTLAAAIVRDYAQGRLDGLPPDLRSDVEFFTHHVGRTMARPVMRIRYLREAYESRGEDPVRITIDTELMHAITFDDELSMEHGRFVTTPLDGTIIEIKFTERFPSWVNDIVRAFALKQQPVPKYILSVDEAMSGRRAVAFSLAGLTLPPLRV